MTYKPSSIALELFHQARMKQQIFEKVKDKYLELNSELNDIAAAVCNFSQYKRGCYLLCTVDMEPQGDRGPFYHGSLWLIADVNLIRPKADSLKPEFRYLSRQVDAQDQEGNLLTGVREEYLYPSVQGHFREPTIKELIEFKKTLKVKRERHQK